jgi:hypothetical protein
VPLLLAASMSASISRAPSPTPRRVAAVQEGVPTDRKMLASAKNEMATGSDHLSLVDREFSSNAQGLVGTGLNLIVKICSAGAIPFIPINSDSSSDFFT